LKGCVEVDRFLIPYRIYGNGGPHLVMINGVRQSMGMWASFVRRFSQKYRIILADLPGQGKAKVLSGPINASLEEEVETLRAVIKASDARNVTLCSASWGGVIALAFASRYPDSVRRMILGSLGTRANQNMIQTIEAGGKLDLQDPSKTADVLIEGFGQNLPDGVKARIKRQFCEMSRESIEAFYEHGLFVIAAGDIDEVVDVQKIQTETLLLNGANDPIIDLEDVRYLSQRMPNCALRVIDNVGHFLHLENDSVLDIYSQNLPAS
jgi:pimeloyl-ACP methyl ester carboxylesterase